LSDPPNGALAPIKDVEGRAIAALVIGIVSIPLIYPLGPLGLWLGISSYRGINRSGGRLAGSGLAIAGIATSGIACGFYAAALLFELLALTLFGSLIPAAP
jgi:hypothetical protein